MRRPLRRVLAATLLGAIAVSAWVLAAPRQLPGGSASYVVPSGTSMLPLLHGDDLVVVREASTYGTGDVIAYHSDELDRIVLHRVIRVEGDRYVTRGDNNDWVDEDRPVGEQVLGRMELRIPGGGSALAWVRTPRNAAVAGTVAAVLLLGGLSVRRRRRRHRRSESPPPVPRPARPAYRVAALGMGVAVLGFGALATFAHLRAPTRTVPSRVAYEHTGSFGYVALARPGAVYPDGRIESGEPVFLRLTDDVGVRFIYRFASEEAHTASGTLSLTADLEDGTGWRRSFPLQEPTAFTGDEAVATGTLDLPALGRLIRQVEKATEIPRPAYTLTLRSSVEVEATLATRPVYDMFSSELVFDANPLMLRVADPEAADEEPVDALSAVRRGSVQVRDELPNPITIGPVHVDVATARSASSIGLGVSALLFLAVGILSLRGRRTEAARIQARYGQRIVPVAAGGASLGGSVVDVATMAALARVADSYERMILHEERDGSDSYLVEGDVAVYRYRTDGVAPSPAGDDRPSVEDLLEGTFLDEPPEPDTRFLDPVEPGASDAAASVKPAPPPWSEEQTRAQPEPVTEPAATGDGDWVADEEWWTEDEDELDAAGSNGHAAPAGRAPMAPSRLARDFFFSSRD